MTHKNRSRLNVDLEGDWKKYLQRVEDGFVAIGTVSMSDNEVFALLYCLSTKKYIGVRDVDVALEFLKLDQRKIKAAIAVSY